MDSELTSSHENEFEDQRCVSKLRDNKIGISRVKSVCCIRISQNWSMKSQVMITSIILFLVIFVVLISITGYNIVKVSDIMKNSQNKLYLSQAQKHLCFVSNRFKRLVITHFDVGSQFFSFLVMADSEKFQRIYSVISQQDNKTSQAPFQKNPNDLTVTPFQAKFTNQSFCYNAYSNGTDTILINTQNQGFMDSVRHFNQIYPLMINQNYTYLVAGNYGSFWTQQQLLYVHPCNYQGLAYRPQNRSWYIEMQNLDTQNRLQNKIYISPHLTQPFLSINSKKKDNRVKMSTVSLQKILFDKNYNFKGAVGSTIYISSFNQLFKLQLNEFTALLVNYDGNLLISPFFDVSLDGISLSVHFSNQTITGYDLEDWQQVINLALGKQITHTCSVKYLDTVTNLLCRWNKVKQRSELIFATHLKVLNNYIVILLDEKNLIDQLFVQQYEIQDKLIQTSILFFAVIIAVFIFLLAILLLIIQIIFQPLRNITTYCQTVNEKFLQKIQKKTHHIELKNIVSSGAFNPITKSFQNLVRKQTGLTIRRYYMCQEIESFQYPKRLAESLMLDDQILQLEDFNKIIDCTGWKKSCEIDSLNIYQLRLISQLPGEGNPIYHNRMLQKKYQKYIQQIQASIKTSGQQMKKDLIQMIFQFYKKI